MKQIKMICKEGVRKDRDGPERGDRKTRIRQMKEECERERLDRGKRGVKCCS